MTEDEQREQARLATDKNRLAIPATVWKGLEALNVSFEYFLTLDRPAYLNLVGRLQEMQIDDDDIGILTSTKYWSMTVKERARYTEPTEEEDARAELDNY